MEQCQRACILSWKMKLHTSKEASPEVSIQVPERLCKPLTGCLQTSYLFFWIGTGRNEKEPNMPKLSTPWHPFSHKLWKLGSSHPREEEMMESLLFGLSGLRSAALPLPLGVFKPSERYCWPLSPSSSLRFAWNKRVQSLVAGHVDDHKWSQMPQARASPRWPPPFHSGSWFPPAGALAPEAELSPPGLRWTNPTILQG